jgi:hypothetical protein
VACTVIIHHQAMPVSLFVHLPAALELPAREEESHTCHDQKWNEP